jgi:hypothetical protein
MEENSVKNSFRDHLSLKQLVELDKYFLKNIGIDCSEIKGAKLTLKKELEALIFITPDRHYTVKKRVVIRKGVVLKIKQFDFQPLGYSNYFVIEIVNSQIIFDGVDKIQVSLEDLMEAVV